MYGGLRPFGSSIMFASNGPDGPELYMADPSGASWVSTILSYSNMLLSIVNLIKVDIGTLISLAYYFVVNKE